MRSLVLCACVLTLASSSSTELTIKEQLKNGAQPIEEDFDTCLTENDLTRDDFYKEEDIMTNVHTKSENEEKTRKIGCWIACVLKKQNLMEESGSIKEGQFHAKLSELFGDSPVQVIAHKIARKCLKEVRGITQECEKCFSMYACVMRAVHKAQKHKDHGTDETEEAVEVAETEETGVAEPAE